MTIILQILDIIQTKILGIIQDKTDILWTV